MQYGKNTETKDQSHYKGPDNSQITEKIVWKILVYVQLSNDFTFTRTHIDRHVQKWRKYCSGGFQDLCQRQNNPPSIVEIKNIAQNGLLLPALVSL